jgi:type II secretory ATPase GspE/PulE/Tfp pilus assembly ATPase PilB-like protein
MGKPVDLVVGNRLVRFCCPDCIKDFNANPPKYLKVLDAAARK